MDWFAPLSFTPAFQGPDPPPTLTLTLESVREAVEVGTVLGRSWFRGHPEVYGNLTPKMFRRGAVDSIVDEFRPILEAETIQSFRNDARAVAHVPVPDGSDALGWLYLMQHFGTPTRLLDWTENPLAALHFAVEKPEVDGELWALYGQALNKRSGLGDGLPFPGNPVLEYLAEEPFHVPNGRDKLARSLGLDGPGTRPVAFVPTRLLARMLVQASVFTIHPRPSPGNTIPEIVTAPEHLVRYIIPKGKKRRIRQDLAALGITHRTLFPDFEGLSRHIVQDMSVIAYSPPEPPDFGRPSGSGAS